MHGNPRTVIPMANFVFVHGAWHGGWCWRRVVEALASQGHRAHAVTLTGLGERAHLMSSAITLETHRKARSFLKRLRWATAYFLVAVADYSISRRLNFRS